jgi:hypothetical protein
MKEKDPELKISEDKFREYRSNLRGNWATRCMQDRAFKSGAMWKQADNDLIESRGQVAPITNEIIPTITLVVHELTKNNPRFYALGRERSDTKTATAVADLMAYIWDISQGDGQNEFIVTDFEDIGMGCWVVYIDPFADNGNGEVKLMAEEPLDVYVSPSSRDFHCDDSPHKLIVKEFSEEDLKSKFPNIDLDGIAPMSDPDLPSHDRATPEDQAIGYQRDDSIKYYRVIDRYSKIKAKRFYVYDPKSNFEKIMKEEDYIQFANELAVIVTKLGMEDEYVTETQQIEFWLGMVRAYGNVFHSMINEYTGQLEFMAGAEHGAPAVPNSTVRIEVVTKGDLLREGVIKYNTPYVDRIQRVYSIGDKVISNYVMEIEDYPVINVLLHHSRNPYPMGDIALVKSLQEQLNKIDNLIITYNQNITNLKIFAPDEGLKKQLEKDGGKAGFQVYKYDPTDGGVPIFVQLTQMSASLYTQRENLIRQIQRIIGAYSFQDGDTSSAPRTLGGTYMMDEMMQRRTSWKRRKLERALNQVGNVVAQMIPLVYDQRKVFKIIKPNHGAKTVSINEPQTNEYGDILSIINDVASIRYDIKVVSNSTLPTNRTQRREEKLRLYEIGMLKDPEWYIRDMDEPDVDEIIQRESMINQAQQTIQQLEEEIKRLRGDLQTANRAEVQAEKKVEVIKTQAELKAITSDIKSIANISKMRMADEVKKTRADERVKTQ